MSSHFIVVRKRAKDGHKVALTIGKGGVYYATGAADIMKFWCADSASRFADFAEATLDRNVDGTEFEQECLLESVRE